MKGLLTEHLQWEKEGMVKHNDVIFLHDCLELNTSLKVEKEQKKSGIAVSVFILFYERNSSY